MVTALLTPPVRKRSLWDSSSNLSDSPSPLRKRASCKRRDCIAQVEYDDYPVGKRPSFESEKLFFGLMNSRETVRLNRARGLEGPCALQGVAPEFSEYFSHKLCPNVRRREDRTTRGLHKFCAASSRVALSKAPSEHRHLLKLIVFNFGLWRYIGGTLAFASEVGFLNDWGEEQKEQIRQIVLRAFGDGRIRHLFTQAYEGPGKIYRALVAKNSDEESLESVLHNTGPKSVRGSMPESYFTLVGKFKALDELWSLCDEIVAVAEPDSAGRTRTRQVADVIGRIPWWGTTEFFRRVPTFFAKELLQDLLDTPVFVGGRAKACDLRTFCPAGPGALQGLMLLYDMSDATQAGRPKMTQSEAIPMMRAILAAASEPHGWKHGDSADLELHDIQFMLCEVQKYIQNGNKGHRLRDYLGPQPLAQCPTAPGILSDRLEEGVALGVISESMRDPMDIALKLTAWLGVGTDNPRRACHGGVPLRSGDRIVLRSVTAGLALVLGPGPSCPMLPENGPATAFRVERAAGAGPLLLGDAFFLRTPCGAHLGPASSDNRFAAPTQSRRWERERLLKFVRLTSRSEFTSAQVCSGDELCLQAFAPLDALRFSLGVCVEVDPATAVALEHASQMLSCAVQECVERGTLRVKQSGALELASAELLRRRLVGVQTLNSVA